MEKITEKLNELREQVDRADAVSEDYRKGFLSAISYIEKLLKKQAASEFHVNKSSKCPDRNNGDISNGPSDLDFHCGTVDYN